MLPVARKPIVQYVLQELQENGVTDILFVTSRSKTAIENHFDSDPILLNALQESGKTGLLKELEFEDSGVQFNYTRQRFQKGLGDAILCGRSFTGNRPFNVALGDSIIGINGQSNCVARMSGLFESLDASCVIAVEEVPAEQTRHYGVVDPGESRDDWCEVRNLVEKPAPEEAPSNLAIAGRYVFSPVIYDFIERVKPDKRGEIQLTDAIQQMCAVGRRVVAYKLPKGEHRYDIGNYPSYFRTFVEFALADPDYGEEFRDWLKQLKLDKPENA